MVRVLFVKRKHFGRINIGDFDKIISYTVYVLKFAARSYFNVRVLPKWHSRYGSQSTFVKYLPVSVLSLAEYLYWWLCFLPIPLLVTLSPTVFHIYIYLYIYIFFFSCWSWLSDNETSFDGKATFGLSILFK